MNIYFVDIYPPKYGRYNKDTNGGYGTAPDYGEGLFSRLLKYIVKTSIDFPPLYVPYVSAVLLKNGHQIEYTRNLNFQLKPDLVILPTSIIAHESELKAVRLLRERDIPVICVGPFTKIVKENFINEGAHVTEEDPVWFFENIDLASLLMEGPRIWIIDRESARESATPVMPRWDVIFNKYPLKLSFLGRGMVFPITFTKGCGFSCSEYCVYPLTEGNRFQSKSVAALVEEMNFIYEQYGVHKFLFRDPIFTFNKKLTAAFCRALQDNQYKFRFGAETHLKLIDEQMARDLHKVGLRLLYVGIESHSERVLSEESRYSEEESIIREKIHLFQSIGIAVKSMYILGFVTQTMEDINRSLKIAKTINSLYLQLNIFTPYPGTSVYDKLRDKILDVPFESYTQGNLVFRHPLLTNDQLRKYLCFAYASYYFRFRWLIQFSKWLVSFWKS